MSTRSAVGYLNPDGEVTAAYVHWDGYPKARLPILKKHYMTMKSVKALVAPGSMSSIRTRETWATYSDYQSQLTDGDGGFVRDDEGFYRKHGDRNPQPLYHHERGDKDVGPFTSGQPLDLWFEQHDCEYLYVFDGKKWIHYSKYWDDGND